MPVKTISEPLSLPSGGSLFDRVPSQIHSPPLSELQSQVDGLVGSAASAVSNEKTMASLFAAAVAGRFIRLGAVAAAGKSLPSLIVQAFSHAAALAGESAVFAGTERKIAAWEGHVPTQSFQKDWARAAINLVSLKAFGGAAQGQNLITQHLLIDLGMVAGHHGAHTLGLVDKPQGDLARQMIEAEGVNLGMKGALALLHGFSPRLSVVERSLDLALKSQETKLFPQEHPFFPKPVMATAGNPEALSIEAGKTEGIQGPPVAFAKGQGTSGEKEGPSAEFSVPGGDPARKLVRRDIETPLKPSRENVQIRSIDIRLQDRLTKIGQISPPLLIGLQWLFGGHVTGTGVLAALGIGVLSAVFSRGGSNTGIIEAVWSWFWFRSSRAGAMHCWGDPFPGWWNSKLISEEMKWLGKLRIRASESPVMGRVKALRNDAKKRNIDLELYLSRALRQADPAELEAGLQLLFKDDYRAKADFIVQHQMEAGADFLRDLLKITMGAHHSTVRDVLSILKKLAAFGEAEPYFTELEKVAERREADLAGESLKAAEILFKAGQKERALPHLRRLLSQGSVLAARFLAEEGHSGEVTAALLEGLRQDRLGIEGVRFLAEKGHREAIPAIRRRMESQDTYDSEKAELLILLGQLGEKAEAMEGAQRMKEPRSRAKVALALGEIEAAVEFAGPVLKNAFSTLMAKKVDWMGYGFDWDLQMALEILRCPEAVAQVPWVRKFAQEKMIPSGFRVMAAEALLSHGYRNEAVAVLKDLLREKGHAMDAGPLLDRIDPGWDHFIPGNTLPIAATAYRGRLRISAPGLPAPAQISMAGETKDGLAELEADGEQEADPARAKPPRKLDR